MKKHYKVFNTVFDRVCQRPYIHCDDVKFIQHEPITSLTNSLIDVPENVRITIILPYSIKISVLSPNLLYNRMDICCNINSELISNYQCENVTLYKCANKLLVNCDENVNIILTFSKLPQRIIPRCSDKYIISSDKGEVVHVNKIGSFHYLDSVAPQFVTSQYHVDKNFRNTSIIPVIMRDVLPIHITCSGELYLDTTNSGFWSITNGKYIAALGSDDKYWGLELPYSKCNVKYDIVIGETEGVIPKLIAYLKFKTDPNTYYIHKDINGKDCELVDLYSGTWTINPQMFGNAILFIGLESFNPKDITFYRPKFTLEIQSLQ